MSRLEEVTNALQNNPLAVAQYLIPSGKVEGSQYRAGNVDGDTGRSLCVDIHKGLYFDQATGDGGDMLDLWSLSQHCSLPDAAKYAAQWLGIGWVEKHGTGVHSSPVPSTAVLPAPVGDMPVRDNPYILEALRNRGITSNVLEDYHMGANGTSMLFPRIVDNQLLAMKSYPVGDKSGIRQSVGSQNTCFGWQACQHSSTLVITEGEIDCMSAYKACEGRFDVVSVPAGATNLKWLVVDAERLAGYVTIILWMDSDEAGQSKVDEILEALGRHRCKNVISAEKDANEVLLKHGVIGVMSEINNAVSAARMSQISMAPENVSDPDLFMEGAIGIFPEINLHAGTTTLLAGYNGTGKSTLALQIAHIMQACGHKPFILSPEMPPKFTAQILVRQTIDIARPNISLWRQACDHVYDNFLISTVEERITPEAAINDFNMAYEMGCRFIILDSITCVRTGHELHQQADFADMLRAWTRSHPDCYLIALCHMRKPNSHTTKVSRYDIRGAGEISDLAGHIWLLERKDPWSKKDAAFYGNYSSKLIVDKNRHTGVNAVKMLNFSPIQKLFHNTQQMPCYLPANSSNVTRIRT